MRIIVSTARLDCVAHRALGQEDVPHEVIVHEDETSYGRLFADLWNAGDPFVLLEHDIAPWPGAMAWLIDCDQPWCVHESPIHPGNYVYAIACGKYRPQGEAPSSWAQTSWKVLEQEIVPHLSALYGAPHVHVPPVAHVRDELIRTY